MSGWIVLMLGILIAGSDFLIGRRWARNAPDRPVLNPGAAALSASALGRIGRILMISAPLVLIGFAAIAFGAVPIDGVEPVGFN